MVSVVQKSDSEMRLSWGGELLILDTQTSGGGFIILHSDASPSYDNKTKALTFIFRLPLYVPPAASACLMHRLLSGALNKDAGISLAVWH